jgi:hypothetical protein
MQSIVIMNTHLYLYLLPIHMWHFIKIKGIYKQPFEAY